MAEKVVFPYEHDTTNLNQIWMAVSVGLPAEDQWKAAFRDTRNGQRVIWVKYDTVPQGHLWVRDSDGARRYERKT
jgi:hypothetical protein